MQTRTISNGLALRQIASTHYSLPSDRLIDFRQVNELTGSRCSTAHNARALAKRGQIKSVRLNERVIRYSERSVLDLVNGVAPVVSDSQIGSAQGEVATP